MELIQDITQIEDKEVPLLCLRGMPIIGPALESKFFEEFKVPQELSLKELLSVCKDRRHQMMGQVEKMQGQTSV